MAVIADVSTVNDIAARGFLSILYLPINSADKCCESEAEPPLPQNMTLFLFQELKLLIELLFQFVQFAPLRV